MRHKPFGDCGTGGVDAGDSEAVGKKQKAPNACRANVLPPGC